MLGGMRDSVTVHMAAPPDQVWALVSDVTRIGEFSPETFEAEWLDGADGPVVGARFRGHVNRNNTGVKYWTVCRVSESVPGRVFAFDVVMGDRVVNSWRYDLEPTGTATSVTESFALARNPLTSVYWAIAGRLRGRTNRRGMLQTLERIRVVVEQDQVAGA
jgi:uncharacterized protein YndB with AHSA1/START domain